MLPQLAFDFPQLNAEPADLDLLVQAPQEFEVAIRPPPHPIAGAI